MVPDPLDALRLPIVPIEPRPAFAADLLRRIQGRATAAAAPAAPTATVRYFVVDLDGAIEFYTEQLDFDLEVRAPTFAMLYRGHLRLLLSVPGGSHRLPDGSLPEPGGWNRVALRVEDLATEVETLRAAGASFRTGIVAGGAVSSALVEDPSGNLVELFEPLAGYHERAPKELIQ
jgi:catechol 2,3-dioxygenase-like lactoylglutathione lyase family enzyme